MQAPAADLGAATSPMESLKKPGILMLHGGEKFFATKRVCHRYRFVNEARPQRSQPAVDRLMIPQGHAGTDFFDATKIRRLRPLRLFVGQLRHVCDRDGPLSSPLKMGLSLFIVESRTELVKRLEPEGCSVRSARRSKGLNSGSGTNRGVKRS
jgi:hypothetical protein